MQSKHLKLCNTIASLSIRPCDAPPSHDAQLPLEGLREVRGEADGRDLGGEVDGPVEG